MSVVCVQNTIHRVPHSSPYTQSTSPLVNLDLSSHNLVMKHIPGADPELVLLNHYYEELDVSPVFPLPAC